MGKGWGFFERRTQNMELRREAKVSEIERSWDYADDPDGLIAARAMSRDERAKMWEVAATMDEEAKTRRTAQRNFSSWYEEDEAPEPEPTDCKYVARKYHLKLMTSRYWDGTYLALLIFFAIALPGYLDERPVPHLAILVPLLGCSCLPVLPILSAFVFRTCSYDFLKEHHDEARNWNIFFVLTLKAFANKIGIPPEFKDALENALSDVCKALVANDSTPKGLKEWAQKHIKIEKEDSDDEDMELAPNLDEDSKHDENTEGDTEGTSTRTNTLDEDGDDKVDAGDIETGGAGNANTAEGDGADEKTSESVANENGDQPAAALSKEVVDSDNPKALEESSPTDQATAQANEVSKDVEKTAKATVSDAPKSEKADEKTDENAFEKTDAKTASVKAAEPADGEGTKASSGQPDASGEDVAASTEKDKNPDDVSVMSVLTDEHAGLDTARSGASDGNKSNKSDHSSATGHGSETQSTSSAELELDEDGFIIKNVRWRCVACGKHNEAPHKRPLSHQNIDVGMRVIERAERPEQVGADNLRQIYAVQFATKQYVASCSLCQTPFDYKPRSSNETQFMMATGSALNPHRVYVPQKPKAKRKKRGPGSSGSGGSSVSGRSISEHTNESGDNDSIHSGDEDDEKSDKGKDDDIDEEEDEEDDDKEEDGDAGDDEEGDGDGDDEAKSSVGSAGSGRDDESGSANSEDEEGSGEGTGNAFLEEMMAEYEANNKGWRGKLNRAKTKFKALRRKLNAYLGGEGLEFDPNFLLFNDYTFRARKASFLPEPPRPDRPLIGQAFAIGDEVESRAHMSMWFPAVVTRLHPNMTCDLKYQNGETVQCVEMKKVRYRLKSKTTPLQQFYCMEALGLLTLWPLWTLSYFRNHEPDDSEINGDDRVPEWEIGDINESGEIDDAEVDDAFYDHLYDDSDDNPERASLLAPLVMLSVFSIVALVLQLLLVFLQGGSAVGKTFLCRLTIFFMAPFICLLVFAVQAQDKIEDPESSTKWRIIFIPLVLFGLFTSAQGFMIKPALGRFILQATFPMFLFYGALSAWLDGSIPLTIIYTHYMFFPPLYLTLNVVRRFYNRLPFIWDARF